MTQPMTARTPAPTTAPGTRLTAPQGSLSIAHGAAPATEGTNGVLSRFEEWTRSSPRPPQ